MLQFFAVLPDYEIKHLSVTAQLQETLTAKFQGDADRFREGKEFVEFDIGYKTDDEELFRVPEFELAEDLQRCVLTVEACPRMTQGELSEGRIRAIIGASAKQDGSVDTAIFKRLDTSKVLDRRKWDLRYDGDTLSRSRTPGLVVPDSVSAVYADGNLYFSSHRTANQVLDLTNLFVEASDADIERFLEDGPLQFESTDKVKELADGWSRRRIKMISSQRVWTQADVSEISDWAGQFGVQIEIATNDVGKSVIKLLEDRPEFKNLLRVLNEDFFEAPFSGRRFLTNSKRPA